MSNDSGVSKQIEEMTKELNARSKAREVEFWKSVAGVGKDEPTVVNEKGGKQSRVMYRFDLLDPHAMFEMTKVLDEGAKKYGENNWHNIPVQDHLNHLIIHAYAYLAGDQSDEHLSHIMCRAMFAQAVDIMNKKKEDS